MKAHDECGGRAVSAGNAGCDFATPAYVFDEAAFLTRAGECRDAIGAGVKLCFSMKANPFLLRVMPDVIDSIEVCSPGELTICERAGIGMDRVIYSGVCKGSVDIRRAVADGVSAVTAESPFQYEMICRAARECGRTVDVLLRLTDGSQFGMDISELTAIIRGRESHPEVKIRGIHYFTGTQKRSTETVIRQLLMLEKLIGSLRDETGFETERLEYGPGLDAEYFTERKAACRTERCPGGKETGDGSSGAEKAGADLIPGSADLHDIELDRLRAVAPALRRLSEIKDVTIEIGRLLASSCGTYYTTVCDTKVNKGVNYAICDGGIHQMRYGGQLQGMRRPVMTVLRDGSPIECADGEDSGEVWTLYGSLCSTADIFVRDAQMPRLRRGDMVAFHNTGAYSVCEGMALFLSRELPQVWLRTRDGSLRLLRERTETNSLNF